jgi:hypothetical protein
MFGSDLLNLKPASAQALRVKFDKSADVRVLSSECIFSVLIGLLQFGQSLGMNDRFSAADVAHVLREFLSALPEPVVPLALYDELCSVLDDRSLDDHSTDRIKATLRHMPSSSRKLLLYMGDLIVTLASHATLKTRMSPHPEKSSNATSLQGQRTLP